VRVITLNMWGHGGPWRARQAVARSQLQHLAPDMLCLQEVVDRCFLLELEEALGLRTLVSDVPGSNLAILGNQAARATSIVTFAAQSPYPDTPRRLCLVELSDGSTLITTHLSWQAHDSATRQRQIEQLLTCVGQGPTLLAGDLNCPLEAPELQQLREAGFDDALAGTAAACLPTWDNRNPYTLPYRATTPDARIDLIVCNPAWRAQHAVCTAAVVLNEPYGEVYASDHLGVLAAFEKRALG
jgi:endonuclease/exonuclease/phosphatase family metal-dependent hydrolase